MKQACKLLFLSLSFWLCGCVGVAIKGTNYLIDSGELDFGSSHVGTVKAAVVDICKAMARDESLAEAMYEDRGLQVNGRLLLPSNIYEEYLGSHYILRVRGASIHFVPNSDEVRGLVNGQLLAIKGTIRSLDFDQGLCSITLKKTTIIKAYPPSFNPGFKPLNWQQSSIINSNGASKIIIPLPQGY